METSTPPYLSLRVTLICFESPSYSISLATCTSGSCFRGFAWPFVTGWRTDVRDNHPNMNSGAVEMTPVGFQAHWSPFWVKSKQCSLVYPSISRIRTPGLLATATEPCMTRLLLPPQPTRGTNCIFWSLAVQCHHWVCYSRIVSSSTLGSPIAW